MSQAVYDNRTKVLAAIRQEENAGFPNIKRTSGVNFVFEDGSTCNDLVYSRNALKNNPALLAEWVVSCKTSSCCCLIGFMYQVLDIDPTPSRIVNTELAQALGCGSASDEWREDDSISDKERADAEALSLAWRRNDTFNGRYLFTWNQIADELEAAWVEGLEDVRP